MSSLTVIILTLNEERHLTRCLESAFSVAQKVFVVDSFSTDRTMEIAASRGAIAVQNEFRNHAAQLMWALENLPIDSDWIMRIDADEVISPQLAEELRQQLSASEAAIEGLLVPLYVRFQGALITHGGYPQWQLRVWRRGKGKIEQRWMDEKIIVNGDVRKLSGAFLDDNLNNIAWWTNKHNVYSTREAIDLLNSKYKFLPAPAEPATLTPQARRTRWIKQNIYVRLPLGTRAVLFYLYRMIPRLGILDGKAGLVFHFLQGFWYRFLVDIKVCEIERRMAKEKISCVDAIRREFGVDPLL